MVTNRRTVVRQRKVDRITPDVVEAYKRALELYDDPTSEIWEEEGGCRRAFFNACNELHFLLGRSIGDYDIVFCTVGHEEAGPPPHVLRHGAKRVTEWRAARDLRRELDQRLAGGQS